jgi:hypothetical protein
MKPTNLDALANALETKGFLREALEIDRLSDKMERKAEAPPEEMMYWKPTRNSSVTS